MIVPVSTWLRYKKCFTCAAMSIVIVIGIIIAGGAVVASGVCYYLMVYTDRSPIM